MGFIARIKDLLHNEENVIEVSSLEGDIVYNEVSLEDLTDWYVEMVDYTATLKSLCTWYTSFKASNDRVISLGTLTWTELSNSIKFEVDTPSNIADSGLFILMFNTTCVAIPYSKLSPNRFVCSAIYDNNGNSMVVRGKLTISDHISVEFDTNYYNAVFNAGLTPPTGICKFINL